MASTYGFRGEGEFWPVILDVLNVAIYSTSLGFCGTSFVPRDRIPDCQSAYDLERDKKGRHPFCPPIQANLTNVEIS
jgi:hypothetical protein